MASWCTLRIGDFEYGGSQRYINCAQSSLFNAGDLVAIGDVGQPEFLRTYRITVGELKTRLATLGYTLASVRDDIRDTAVNASGKRQIVGIPSAESFIDFLKEITIEKLIELVKSWESRHDKFDLKKYLMPNFTDFDAALLDFVQGDTIDLLGDDIWINGHHFECLLSEVFPDDENFELDFTELVKAGYYEVDDAPLGNLYDEALALITPGSFRVAQHLIEEESEVLEFKSVTSANPCASISSVVTRYVIGFLNGVGGRVLFGVDDFGRVTGVTISRQDRDELQRKINAACAIIVPAISFVELSISFRPIISAGRQLEDRFVVEVEIQRGRSTEMYFKPNGETWVRVGTETRALKGHELFVHICTRYARIGTPISE